jgi:hypothetical protein
MRKVNRKFILHRPDVEEIKPKGEKGRDYPENFAFESHGCDCMRDEITGGYKQDEDANERALSSL